MTNCVRKEDEGMKIRPIKPDEVTFDISKPPEVIKVFNRLISENWDGVSATFRAGVATRQIALAMAITTDEVYDQHLLDVEPLYRDAGWKVEYRSPGFNENPFPPTFKFTKPKES